MTLCALLASSNHSRRLQASLYRFVKGHNTCNACSHSRCLRFTVLRWIQLEATYCKSLTQNTAGPFPLWHTERHLKRDFPMKYLSSAFLLHNWWDLKDFLKGETTAKHKYSIWNTSYKYTLNALYSVQYVLLVHVH